MGERVDFKPMKNVYGLILGLVFPMLLTSAVLAGGEESAPRFQDVRLGEEPDASRVAVVCAGPCAVMRGVDGQFLLSGVSGQLSLDLSERGGFVVLLEMDSFAGGAVLNVGTRGVAAQMAIADCGSAMICLDFLHEAPLRQRGDAARRGFDDTRLKEAVAVGLGAVEQLRRDKAVSTLAAISPAPLNQQTCTRYKTVLQEDGWNLTAYKMVALCKAASGALQEADGLFARLQTFLPEDETARQARPAIARLESARRRGIRQAQVRLR